ncbi:von Willebrand factor A domain-containing protein 5A [Fasciola hepatica]|uniref:von Willebrand factor A domain-containing protein 5A n=1 Tax=Fasciola hepatica TaxID=6192 RepID=A0A4E0RY86_FASHE|nr:von Willebrand factor A domain-containing protein 5A [Fasciola hepatica]
MAEQDEHCEDVFQLKLGAIPSHTKVIIRLKYVGLIEAENNVVDGKGQSFARFTLPTVLNPRYQPPDVTDKGTFESLECKGGVKAYSFNFNAELNMPVAVLNVSSPLDTFDTDWTSSDRKTAKVKLSSDFKYDHDLQMTIHMDGQLASFAVYERGQQHADGIIGMDCLMTQWMPDFSHVRDAQELRTELYFVIDRSGSMSGDRIQKAAQALLLFLKSIPIGCRFQIIGFGNTFNTLFPEPVEYNDDNAKRALDYQRELEADMGGTEVLPALHEAFRSPLTGAGWYKQIIFLTDGEVGNADEVVGLVGSNVHQARVFSVGLGMGASSYLVEGVARAGRGVSAFVRDNNELRTVTMKILKSALQPRACNVQVKWDVKAQRADGTLTPVEITPVPQEIPPIFDGCFLTVYGLFTSGDGASLTGKISLECDVLSTPQTFQINMAEVMKRSTASGNNLVVPDLPLHRLAGKCQLNELSDKHKSLIMRDENNPFDDADVVKQKSKNEDPAVAEIRVKLERLSCCINVMCPFTAFIGVDPVKNETVTQPVPHRPRMTGHFPNLPVLLACGTTVAVPKCAKGVARASTQVLCGSRGSPMTRFCGDFAGPCGMINTESAQCALPESDKLLALADLQSPTGFWELDEKLAKQLDMSVAQIKTACPSNWSEDVKVPVSDKVWATVLVLAYLNLCLSDRSDEWSLFSRKARTWLEAQATTVASDAKLITALCDTLMKKAQIALHPK